MKTLVSGFYIHFKGKNYIFQSILFLYNINYLKVNLLIFKKHIV